jgi:hypothetical protein
MMKTMLLGLVFLATLMGGDAMATEEPAFKLEVKSGAFEVRDYPPMIAAEVSVTGDRGAAVNAGFRLLAAYIFGGNTKKQSIAMTAPVVQAPKNETIPMTAPVVQTGAGNAWTVQFIMPAGSTLETLPTPDNPKVKIIAVPATRIAVVRFSGLAGEADIRRQTAALNAFIAERRLHAIGPAALSRYDPPWTPWFMRRNEIWIPVER